MSNGIIIFAHNSKSVDYGLMSIISGGLAKKYLNHPVSLITDTSTVDWLKHSNVYGKAVSIFDQIILTEAPETTNVRVLNDGIQSSTVPFKNSNRASAWDLTPYDVTLMIDSDFLIFSDNLNNFWNVNEDVLISTGMLDMIGNRVGVLDKRVSDTGIKMYWATTVMFRKNQQSRIFFDLVNHVKNNYEFYSDIFRFNSKQYRNDISFSIAKHILDGFSERSVNGLPPILTTIDKDVIFEIDNLQRCKFLLYDAVDFIPASISNRDVHIMNKQSIIRNQEKLLKLI